MVDKITVWTQPGGCSSCNHCGMDMDLDPYCVKESVLTDATEKWNKRFPYGLVINDALVICQHKEWEERGKRDGSYFHTKSL